MGESRARRRGVTELPAVSAESRIELICRPGTASGAPPEGRCPVVPVGAGKGRNSHVQTAMGGVVATARLAPCPMPVGSRDIGRLPSP